MPTFHYAIQVCDKNSFQNLPRYCGIDRTLLSKKSLTSFLNSVQHVAIQKKFTNHFIKIFVDNSTNDLIDYIKKLIENFNQANINLTYDILKEQGISNSIKQCYLWLEHQGKDFVYQIQDDYIFEKETIYDITSIWFQMHNETNTEAVITPYHDTYVWLKHYRNWASPRTFIIGEKDFWIQIYDIACTFFTSKTQFSKHWDLYNEFLKLIDQKSSNLENKSLNYMFTKKGILGICPIRSLALHMQTDLEKDPYIDWKARWDSIELLQDEYRV